MFKAAADDIPTYRTIASGMMHAGLAVALVSMDTESCNHAKCHQWVCDLFGQEGAKKGDLCQNLLRMQQQIRCNSTDVQWMDEAPTVKTKEFIPSDNGIAFTYINEAVGRKRILYASNLWYKLTDFERGATWVHEISHACLGTHDYQAEGGYNPEAVAKFPWPKASTCAKNYELFCMRAFHYFLSGDMLSIAPPLQAEVFTKDYHVEPDDLEHIPGQLCQNGHFLVQTIGDMVGNKASGGPRRDYHQVVQYWDQMAKVDGNHFGFRTAGAGGIGESSKHPASDPKYFHTKMKGRDEKEHAVISDGMNTSYIKMISGNIGFGIVECGGPGGRSFRAVYKGAKVNDGRV